MAALTQAGVPQGMAEAVAELFAAVAAGRVAPKGDRRESGATTIDELLPALIAS